MLVSRWIYYLSSIPALLAGVKNGPRVARALLDRSAPRPFMIELRSGPRFWVRSAMDIWIVKETCLDRQYERASVPIQDGWTVVDIGAALGDFAISVARARPASRVYAFEPFPDSYLLLQKNIAVNRVDNVFPSPYAIGGGDSQMRLAMTTAEAVQHTTVAGGATRGEHASMQVSSMTLDRAIDVLGTSLPRCDYLKVDCEGGEYEIFFGASEATLKSIRHICLEYHDGVTPYSHDDLVRFFERHGFQVRCTPNRAHRHLGLLHARNTVFDGGYGQR